jgi:ribosome maturation factor RimP
MAVEDCEALSRALSPLLDAEDPIKAEYTLEVSSPGIDRPMVALEDFTRFVGHEVKLETAQMLDGRKRFKGAILGVAGEKVRVKLPEGEFEVPFALLHEARLVLTDKLIKEDFKRHAAAQKAQDKAEKAEAQAAKQAKKRKPT